MIGQTAGLWHLGQHLRGILAKSKLRKWRLYSHLDARLLEVWDEPLDQVRLFAPGPEAEEQGLWEVHEWGTCVRLATKNEKLARRCYPLIVASPSTSGLSI